MPFKITEDVREITKKIGKQSLTLTYKPHAYTATQQTQFLDTFGNISKKCPDCGAKLELEEMPEREREALRKKGQTNGHAMWERATICSQCGSEVRSLERLTTMMAKWLGDNLAEADWEDEKGQIPLTEETLLERVPFELMMTAFNMVVEDKQGKD